MELVSTGISLSVLGHRKDIIRFIHDFLERKTKVNKDVLYLDKITTEIINH